MMKPPEGMSPEEFKALVERGQRQYKINGKKPPPKQAPMEAPKITWLIRYQRFSVKLVPFYPLLWLALGIYLLINAM